MIGLGLGLVRQAVRNASGRGWTPAELFTNGQQGVWYEPKPQYLYQDAAGTTPVTADGDPVGYMADLSGNGNHATQSTSAARPIYRTDGTLHWLDGDGVDDHFKLSSLTLNFAQTVAVIASRTETNLFSTNQFFGWRPDALDRFYAFGHGIAKGGAIQQDVSPLGLDHIRTYRWGDPAFSLHIDRTPHASGSDSVFGDIEIRVFLGGSGSLDIDGVSNTHQGRFYGAAIVRETPDNVAISNAEQYLASISGVTL